MKNSNKAFLSGLVICVAGAVITDILPGSVTGWTIIIIGCTLCLLGGLLFQD
jgi:1,4-dihydroxy-2-naphthoate octaprenyltransferase